MPGIFPWQVTDIFFNGYGGAKRLLGALGQGGGGAHFLGDGDGQVAEALLVLGQDAVQDVEALLAGDDVIFAAELAFQLLLLVLVQLGGFQHGQVWGLSVAWSGDTNHIIERQSVGRTQIGAGELLMPGEVTLAKGESYQAPTVVAVYSNTGIDGASDRFHRYVRARSNHPTEVRPRPVTLNVWEAVYMEHDLEKLSALA